MLLKEPGFSSFVWCLNMDGYDELSQVKTTDPKCTDEKGRPATPYLNIDFKSIRKLSDGELWGDHPGSM